MLARSSRPRYESPVYRRNPTRACQSRTSVCGSREQLPAKDGLACDLTLVVADGNVLGDNTVVVIRRVRRDHTLLGKDRVVLRDELAEVVVGLHSFSGIMFFLNSLWISRNCSRRSAASYEGRS